MKMIKNFFVKNYKVIFLLILFFFFFSFPVLILFDSAHYMSFVEIFERNKPFATWDIVRGPVFPMLIFLSNKLFGKTAMGLLIMCFLLYLLMIVIVGYLLKFLSDDSKKKKIFIYLCFILLVLLNPIVFGYYHTLLTEGVAITIAILSSFLAWKFLFIEKKDKSYFIFLSIYFVVMTPFSWFLKQPYLSIVLFPLIVVAILRLFLGKSFIHRVQILCVLLASLFSLFVSINLWDGFLRSKGIDLHSERNIVGGFGNQILSALSNIRIKKTENQEIAEIEILNESGDVVEISEIKKNDIGFIATKDSVLFILQIFFKYPLTTVKSYVSNYLALINLYKTYTPDSINYYIESKNLVFDGCVENCVIATSILNKKSNIYYMSEDMYARVKDYEQYLNTPPIQRGMLSLFVKPSIIVFNISFLLLPFVLISLVTYWIISKPKYGRFKQKALALSLILLSFSFLHLIVHTVTGAIIDRYAVPSYITTILGYISFCLAFLKKEKD